MQAEEDEEHRGEQVPQRCEQFPGGVRERSRQGDADKERPDRRRHLQALRHAGHQQGEPQHLEDEYLVARAVQEPFHHWAVPQRHQQHDRDRHQGDPEREGTATEPGAAE